ncbi:MAG: LPS assembly lipoprotein LptE [Geminicoccaceae bacterium]
MWSSEAAPATRRTALVAAGLALAACTLRPLLHATNDQGVRSELEAISITGLDDRLGQLVRNALLDELNPTGAPVPSRYILDVELQRSAQALGIQLDNVITRFNLTLTASFQLLDSKSGELLYQSQVQRIASYNVSLQPYATLAAEVDAERRIAREVGDNITTLLAVHFAQQATPT